LAVRSSSWRAGSFESKKICECVASRHRLNRGRAACGCGAQSAMDSAKTRGRLLCFSLGQYSRDHVVSSRTRNVRDRRETQSRLCEHFECSAQLPPVCDGSATRVSVNDPSGRDSYLVSIVPLSSAVWLADLGCR